MSTMPRTAHTIPFFPLLLPFANRNDAADYFVSWDARERRRVAKSALLQKTVRVADATSMDFDEDLAGLGRREGDFFDCPWCTRFF
jgi:hypothetical protein